MGLCDYLVLGGLLIAIICIIVFNVRRKKQGMGGCGCCSYSENCNKKTCK